MDHDNYPENYTKDILTSVKTIAVVGASPKEERPSYGVSKLLMSKGHRVHPVNPGFAGKEILGRPVSPNLASVPEPIDMVDVFRRSEFLDEIIRSAVALKDEKSLRAIWLQLGLTHPVAEAFARARGLDVISDRCPKIELKRERITT